VIPVTRTDPQDGQDGQEPPAGDPEERPLTAPGPGPVRLNIPAGLQIGTDPCPTCGSTIRPCRCNGGMPAILKAAGIIGSAQGSETGETPVESASKAEPGARPGGSVAYRVVGHVLTGNPGTIDLERETTFYGTFTDPDAAAFLSYVRSVSRRYPAQLIRVYQGEAPRWDYVRGRKVEEYALVPAATFSPHATAEEALAALVTHFEAVPVVAAVRRHPELNLILSGRPVSVEEVLRTRAGPGGPAVPGTRPGADPDETIEISQD
jgi:hypothetical protein